MSITELETELERLKKELKTAGVIHSRDLRKHISRLEKEKATYYYYQRQAKT